MNLRLSLALAACGVVTASSGCTTPNSAFRGQSPDTVSVYPTGWNPGHFGQGEQFYTVDETFVGGSAYGPNAEMSRRERKMMERGIIPPPGSPYAGGYVPTPYIDPETTPDHMIGGVKVYDVGMQGWRPPKPPAGVPWQELRGQPYDLMPGGCPVSGADYIRWMPTHYHSFRYNRPADLTYPSQNSVGGAVSYTYYTLKGPSDFFHDKDGIY